MVVCRMTLLVCKKKRSKIEKKTKWWKLKKEECCEEFRQKLRQALGGQVVLPDDWETTAEVIRETGRKVLGVSSGRRKEDKETWWWNEEVQDSIQRKRLAKKKWDMDRTEENRQEYKELQRRVKREVSKAKQKAYDELYTRLDTREGEKDLYRLARQRDRDGKDVQQVRVIKDRDGRVLTSEESVQRRWKEYFEELMNEENEREKRVEGVNSVEQKVDKIRKDEVRKALKRMKSGKAVGPDDIPVEVWKCLGEAAVEFLTSLFNRVLESERMPEEWRSVLVRIKEKVYRTVVRAAMLYGLETVSLRKRQESELEVAELKMLRFSLGVTRLDRIRNEYIRGTAHVGRLGDKVREDRLRWFGHVQRRESEYIGRRMLDMELPGRRQRGRPKRSVCCVYEPYLRHVERDVLIPKMMREKAKELCAQHVEAFTQCCKDSGLLMVVKCREENNTLKQCLTKHYTDPVFYEECKQQYIKEKQEYERTGISAKHRAHRLPTGM
ncbi:hypothetical protein QTP86_014143 [Hemibagrus guttatus]|nr:hypothetical protein QTP86_014143 [Hemibagrus guttatus]